ncbi:MAG: response regulator transcription factor [Saprospiraceae bacterium]
MLDRDLGPMPFVILDDDDFWRGHIETVLVQTGHWDCILSVSSSQALKASMHLVHEAQVVLIDIMLQGESGLDVLVHLRKTLQLDCSLVMLTSVNDDEVLHQAIQLGANGYVLKSSDPAKITQALEALFDNGAPISPEIAKKLIARMQGQTPSHTGPQPSPILSAKEWQILRCLANGDSYENAAARLRMSINTFRYYIKKIYRSIHVENRSEASRWYFENKE